MAIDPERVRAHQQTRDAHVDAPVLAEPPAPSAPPGPATPGPARRSEFSSASPANVDRGSTLRGARFALHGVAGAGPLPRLGAGLEATLGWHRQSVRVQLVGRYWVPREKAVNDAAVSLDLALNTLGARACWQVLAGAWEAAACAGGDLGDMSASGSGLGLQKPRTPHALYGDLAGGLELAYKGSRLMPEGGVELSGALSRPSFGIGLGVSSLLGAFSCSGKGLNEVGDLSSSGNGGSSGGAQSSGGTVANAGKASVGPQAGRNSAGQSSGGLENVSGSEGVPQLDAGAGQSSGGLENIGGSEGVPRLDAGAGGEAGQPNRQPDNGALVCPGCIVVATQQHAELRPTTKRCSGSTTARATRSETTTATGGCSFATLMAGPPPSSLTRWLGPNRSLSHPTTLISLSTSATQVCPWP